jgi:hypothetical protein
VRKSTPAEKVRTQHVAGLLIQRDASHAMRLG